MVNMSDGTAVIAVFSRHAEADAAIRKLAKSGLDMKHFSVIGRGYHSEERSSVSTMSATA
jgi:hypothetical protein